MREPAAPSSLFAQVIHDLAPFPGRAALTWRIALLCALVSAAAMLYKIPEAAISCYLIIFLMKPDAVQNIGTAFGLIVLVVIVVLFMVPLINMTVESPLLRMLAIAVCSFIFLFIGAASQLGEIGGVIALVISFVLTLVSMAPFGDAVTIGLRYAAYMAMMPMALMIAFNLLLGLSPVRLLYTTVRGRLAETAEALESGNEGKLEERLTEDNAALEKQAGFVRLLNLVRRASAEQIARDVRASYRLMLAASCLPKDLAAPRRQALADAVRKAVTALEVRRQPEPPPAPPEDAGAAERECYAALAVIAGAPEGEVIPAPKEPFFFPDALSNPDYQRFALKTTAAAIICYVIYTGLNWQGIHTAMITCYVAALGTTGETVHKLTLRICGCLVGAALGIGATLFVVPYIDTIGGLMVLVFLGVLVGAWVSTGPERIAYAGVQVALAFLLTVLQGFAPATSLDPAWDRIVGILLGNVVVFLIFTRIWPVSVEQALRGHLASALAGLKRLAALAPERRRSALPDAALIAAQVGKADELLDFIRFEPLSIRPSAETVRNLRESSEAITRAMRALVFGGRADAEAKGEVARIESVLAK